MPARSSASKAESAAAADEDLQAQIAALRAEVARLTETLASRAQPAAAAESLMADLQRRAHDLGDRAGAALHDAALPADQLTQAVASYARKDPLKALALATGAGMVLGLLFGRRG